MERLGKKSTSFAKNVFIIKTVIIILLCQLTVLIVMEHMVKFNVRNSHMKQLTTSTRKIHIIFSIRISTVLLTCPPPLIGIVVVTV